MPNDPIPQPRETRPARRVDCNQSAMAGFAAVHGEGALCVTCSWCKCDLVRTPICCDALNLVLKSERPLRMNKHRTAVR
jgi:hypothetical protein